MMSLSKEKYTGERLETFFFNQTTIEHLHRYAFASDYIKDKVVLDIASGEGYGTSLLSDSAKKVYGVDIDNKAISRAKIKYNKENICFLVGSTSSIPLDDKSIDVVVSFETIEHHDQHEKMIFEIKRVLKVDGILILSTPDKKVYSDDRNYKNPFHVKELYKHEFKNLLKNEFNNLVFFGQKYFFGVSFLIQLEGESDFSFYGGDFNKLENIKKDSKYLIAIASNKNLSVKNSFYEAGDKIRMHEQNIIINKYKNSISYRLGQFILKPYYFLKKTTRQIFK